MHFNHISIGGGVTGIQTILSAFAKLQNQIKKSKLIQKRFKYKRINFAVIDRDYKNIPGGIAYGFDISKYGYFNNPIRLSPKIFTKWLLKKENKLKVKNYLNKHGGFSGKEWLKKNERILFSSNAKDLNELYIPRTILNFWIEQNLIFMLSQMKEMKVKYSILFNIKFFQGEVLGIKIKGNLKELTFKKNFCNQLKFKVTKNPYKKLFFTNYKKIYKPLTSISQLVGVGLPPPRQLATQRAQKNKYYIWDFYSQGSTSLLMNKILFLSKHKKKIKIYFIGYKAGLLESLPELKNNILNKNLKLEIICSSKNLQSIQEAKLSFKKTYKINFFNKKSILQITKANDLYSNLVKEFKLAVYLKFKIYDAWTQILKQNIIDKCIKNFNAHETKLYHDLYHAKIRNITRFTYPETIYAREKLFKMGILKTKKEIVKKVDFKNKNLVVETTSNKKISKNYTCDMVVNVSGPLNVDSIKNEMPLVNSLKKNGASTLSGGFVVDKNFQIEGIKNLYTTGILARGFNPKRKTIINAILENSSYAGQCIAETLILM